MVTSLPTDADVGDADAQYLIAVAEMLESARLGGFVVEAVTRHGETLHGVPRALHAAGGAGDPHWGMFFLGSSTVRLEEIACCTAHSRQSSPQASDDRPPARADVPDWGRRSAVADAVPAETGGGRHMHVTMPADLLAPACARQLTATFLERADGLDEQARADARLIVSELVSNVALHAYEEPGSGALDLDLSLHGGSLTILVSDEGRGPRTGSPRERGRRPGSGWMIIAQLSDEFIITQRGQGGTLVEVRLTTARSPRPHAPEA